MAHGQGLAHKHGNWLIAAFSGLMTGTIAIVVSVSLAALIFAADFSAYLGLGINIALVTATVTGLVFFFSGGSEVAISIPQDRAAPILAIMAASIAAAAPAGMPDSQVVLNVVTAIVASTLVAGGMLLGLGLARAGNLMRFLPYSVLGGFFAGTGWLLVLGGMRVMTGLELNSPADARYLADADLLAHWVPGVLLAAAVFIGARHIRLGAALPLVLVVGTGLFYLVMLHDGMTLDALIASGWLLGPLQNDTGILTAYQLLMQGDWSTVLAEWANIGTVAIILSISLILTVSALETLSGQDIDINRELRIAGVANLAAGLGGGMVGCHSLSVTGFALQLGANTRFTGAIAALTAGAALLFGADIIGFLPRIAVGGLLLFLGGSFLGKWLIDSWGRLPRGEYLVIPLILTVIATTGFIEGLVAGLLAAVVLFVLNYSRSPVIRYALSGEHARSTVERSLDDERCLAEHGAQLHILKLRGYLFFGTAAQLSGRVRERAEDSSAAALKYVLLDFEYIYGIDSSAAYEFQRMRLLAARQGFVLILTGLKPQLRVPLYAGQIIAADQSLREFVDLDHGLEWCEEQLLAARELCRPQEPQTALQHLSGLFANPADARHFLSYLSEVAFDRGDELIRQGESSSDLFFLEQGEVSVYLQPADGDRVRIRRTGAGTVLGELGFYLDTRRSASVIADCAGRAYRLTTDALARMQSERPDLAAALHRFMADLLAERLLRTTRTLEAVIG